MPSIPRCSRAGRSWHGSAERGAAAVEFALVLAPLLLILLGAMDWGYYFYIREVVTDAARAGARAGSLNPGSELSAATSILTSLNLTAASAQPCTVVPPKSVCVRIDYPTPSLTGLTRIGGLLPATASARATMPQEP